MWKQFFAFVMSAVLTGMIAGALFTGAAAQNDDTILVRGNPPLTQLMVGKVIVLLDWVLELKLAKEQELQIKQVLIKAWKANDQADMRGALDIIEIYEKVFKMSEPERNGVRGNLKELMLKSIRAEKNDELAAMLLAAYEAAHGGGSATVPTSSVRTAAPAKSGLRVGGDGFTGVYRMVRPRAIDINSSMGNSGVWIEYITFLPNGNVYWSLPPEGLLYFDPALTARWDADDWGTYTIKNDEIHVLRGPSKKLYVITRNGERLNNPPSLGKGTFRPVPNADGLRLEGNYRSHESEPTITFTRDGNFRDGGVYLGTLVRPDGSHYQDDRVPGSGTYLIEQNTLELRYSDGRVKRHPFIAFPENIAKKPAVDSFILRREESFSRY